MSEYQYVGFRAVRRPVSTENLDFMRKQSTRAEVTPWSFHNEYHYGDFRGDGFEMLRRGYDIYIHYANYDMRHVFIRLPDGLPDAEAFAPYLGEELLKFEPDKNGPGGCLCIRPWYDSRDLEQLWEFDELLDDLAPICDEIWNGDLRPIYLAHLAVASDDNHDPDETMEGPIPAGLDELSDPQYALAMFLGLSESLIAAAERETPPLSIEASPKRRYRKWLRSISKETKVDWLTALMLDPDALVREEILEKYRADAGVPSWPTAPPKRTITELETIAEEISAETKRKADAEAARQRIAHLKKIAKNPQKVLEETEQLADQGSTSAYESVAELLADLREALMGTPQAGLAEQHALKLKAERPTKHKLAKRLRDRGFLSK